jgi:hypothetical protein
MENFVTTPIMGVFFASLKHAKILKSEPKMRAANKHRPIDPRQIFGLRPVAPRRLKASRNGHTFYFEGERLNAYVDALNYLYPAGGWESSRAAKDHLDLFGDKIEDRDFYFKLKVGQAFHDVIKISRRSMDCLLFALFGHRNWVLQETLGELRKRAVAGNAVRRQRDCWPLPFWTKAESEE